jgi:hypothetical protein
MPAEFSMLMSWTLTGVAGAVKHTTLARLHYSSVIWTNDRHEGKQRACKFLKFFLALSVLPRASMQPALPFSNLATMPITRGHSICFLQTAVSVLLGTLASRRVPYLEAVEHFQVWQGCSGSLWAVACSPITTKPLHCATQLFKAWGQGLQRQTECAIPHRLQ